MVSVRNILLFFMFYTASEHEYYVFTYMKKYLSFNLDLKAVKIDNIRHSRLMLVFDVDIIIQNYENRFNMFYI